MHPIPARIVCSVLALSPLAAALPTHAENHASIEQTVRIGSVVTGAVGQGSTASVNIGALGERAVATGAVGSVVEVGSTTVFADGPGEHVCVSIDWRGARSCSGADEQASGEGSGR
jgi:hypothetical protein